jgi:hypothetical protein
MHTTKRRNVWRGELERGRAGWDGRRGGRREGRGRAWVRGRGGGREWDGSEDSGSNLELHHVAMLRKLCILLRLYLGVLSLFLKWQLFAIICKMRFSFLN